MKFLYLIIGLIIGSTYMMDRMDKIRDQDAKNWQENTQAAFLTAYYEGWEKGKQVAIKGLFHNVMSCIEEVEENRIALMGCQAAHPAPKDFTWTKKPVLKDKKRIK